MTRQLSVVLLVVGAMLASIGAIFIAIAVGHAPVYGTFNSPNGGGTTFTPDNTFSAAQFSRDLAIGLVLAIIGVTATIAGLIDYARRSR